MKLSLSTRSALSRSAAVGIAVILVVAVAGGIYYFSTVTKAPSTSSATSTSTPTSTSTTSSSSVYGPSNKSQLVDDSWGFAYDSLDPQWGFFTVDGFFANVFQGLVQFNGSDSDHVVPSIASNWTASNGYKTWTFTIRSGVTFSNGDPVNAYTGWFSFERGYLLNAPLGTYVSNYPNLLENVSYPCTGSLSAATSCIGENGDNITHTSNAVIWGTAQATANAFGIKLSPNADNAMPALLNVLDNFNPSNKTQLAIMENPSQGVYVVNAHTLVLNLLQPYPNLLIVLPPQWGSFVDPTWIDNRANCGGVVNNTVCTNFSTKGGPGTGPYEYSTIGPSNSFVVLKANPTYWAKSYNWASGTPSQLCLSGEVCQPVLRPPSITEIVMNFGVSETTVIGDFDSNAVQLTAAVAAGTPIGVPHFSTLISGFDDKQYASFTDLAHNAGYPLCDLANGINGQVYPTNYTDFREVIAHAVNYSEYVSQIYTYNGVSFGQLFMPPVPPGWGPLDNPNNIPLYSYNLTLAAQYLNDSGRQGHFYTVTTEDITNPAGTVVIPAGTTLGDPKGTRLAPITYQYIVPLTAELETENEILAAGLTVLGVSINFQGITTAVYSVETTGALSGNFQGLPNMVEVGWCADYPDPMFQQFAPMVVAGLAGELSASVTNSTINTLTLRIPFESPAKALADAKTVWAMYVQRVGISQVPNGAYVYWSQPYLSNIVYSSFQFAYYYNMMTYGPS